MGELVDLDLYRRKRRRRHGRAHHTQAPPAQTVGMPALPEPVQAPRLEPPRSPESARTDPEPPVLAPKERDDPTSA